MTFFLHYISTIIMIAQIYVVSTIHNILFVWVCTPIIHTDVTMYSFYRDEIWSVRVDYIMELNCYFQKPEGLL